LHDLLLHLDQQLMTEIVDKHRPPVYALMHLSCL
jgi:hypothetical protein